MEAPARADNKIRIAPESEIFYPEPSPSSIIIAPLTFLSCTIIGPEITIAVIRCVIATSSSSSSPLALQLPPS